MKVILLLLFTSFIYAGQGSFARYGIGVFNKDDHSFADIKTVNLGYQDELFLFDYKYETGFWVDQRKELGRKSAGFLSASLGLEPRIKNFYLNSFWGIALISKTDTLLSTYYEFMQDFGVGFKDYRGIAIGLNYKHLSNAGIKLPNKGRDFLSITLQLPF